MSGRDWRLFGRLHAKLYQRLGGRFVDSVGLGRKVLLLTTTGRKSGLERTTPLVYMPLGDDVIVYPSNGGQEPSPAWWLNLQAEPVAIIQIGKERRQVRARAATESEYEELWPKAADYNPHWRSYKVTVARAIPLVLLERVDV
ncbi:MAG: nitroreductase/quinone reductase family protein [Polyangiales bacterium]|jgi:deazaflavin-dependent oxidoreductase (nitroreductase family)